MESQPPIEWRLHLRSSAAEAFEAWTTDVGRERFWAEESRESAGRFTLRFTNGHSLEVAVLESAAPRRFVFRYFGGSTVALTFEPDGSGGCDLHLKETDPEDHAQNHAGWVSVLLAFKAALDFGVDLRGHDPDRSWDRGYVDG